MDFNSKVATGFTVFLVLNVSAMASSTDIPREIIEACADASIQGPDRLLMRIESGSPYSSSEINCQSEKLSEIATAAADSEYFQMQTDAVYRHQLQEAQEARLNQPSNPLLRPASKQTMNTSTYSTTSGNRKQTTHMGGYESINGND